MIRCCASAAEAANATKVSQSSPSGGDARRVRKAATSAARSVPTRNARAPGRSARPLRGCYACPRAGRSPDRAGSPDWLPPRSHSTQSIVHQCPSESRARAGLSRCRPASGGASGSSRKPWASVRPGSRRLRVRPRGVRPRGCLRAGRGCESEGRRGRKRGRGTLSAVAVIARTASAPSGGPLIPSDWWNSAP